MKDFPQTLHSNSLLSPWLREWVFNSIFLLNLFPQIVYLKSLRSVWTTEWNWPSRSDSPKHSQKSGKKSSNPKILGKTCYLNTVEIQKNSTKFILISIIYKFMLNLTATKIKRKKLTWIPGEPEATQSFPEAWWFRLQLQVPFFVTGSTTQSIVDWQSWSNLQGSGKFRRVFLKISSIFSSSFQQVFVLRISSTLSSSFS